MRIFILIIAWIHRYEIARFLGRTFRKASDACRRLSAERAAERETEEARARDYAGPHGGFDTDAGGRPY